MLKKILDKRITQFKNNFQEFEQSKKTDSIYHRQNSRKQNKSIKYTGRAITKGSIDKIGTTNKWQTTVCDAVYLLTSKGRLMISERGGNFRAVTTKTLLNGHEELRDIFFIGRKYEWMKDYRSLWSYKFFQGFNSLGESKKFLGYSFISDSDFVDIFNQDDWYDFLAPMVLAREKKYAVRLLKNINTDTKDLLKDYIDMCQDNDYEVEIPAGANKLEELHDTTMWKVNEKNSENYSKEYRYDVKEDFTKVWKERGLAFKRLETPYEMFVQGIKQTHCIGTNYATSLGRFVFYSFAFEGREYDIQIYNSGYIGQFKGKRNSNPPSKLKNLVDNDVDLKFTLTDTKPNLEGYPFINPMLATPNVF